MNQKSHEMQANYSEDVTVDSEFKIANEFTTVIIRRLVTKNGVRLEIVSPRLGHSIRLDPLELESLTWQNVETFSKFLELPFGPQD
ncbi:dihydrodiol dehydrogenase [Bacillus sp. Marseille-P3661]|uniref:dihydrodiol dehydrogenase n=1 Tax=Bacillus sp. Marseille-P3661 TaxID=1936234 RepID=UPI001CA534D0|nr:dihydrodiol dehydrogenase [Bacillus sp. Marseille-P3661]